MYVTKRNGEREDVHFDKITSRIKKLCYGLDSEFVDPASITLKVSLPPCLRLSAKSLWRALSSRP